MIRSELCLVADIKPATFNSHRRNGDLPFTLSPQVADEDEGRAWSRFDIYDAALLIAAKNLAAGQGVSWSEAARILREAATHLGSDFDGRRQSFRDPGFHCARIEFRCEDGHEPNLIRKHHVVRGSLADIAGYAERVVASHNSRQHFPHDRIAVYSIASVSLSQAWQIAVGRAQSLMIGLDGEFAPHQREGEG